MSSEKGPKYIYTQECKLYYYYYHFGAHGVKKMTTKQSEEYLFHECCKEMATNTVMAY